MRLSFSSLLIICLLYSIFTCVSSNDKVLSGSCFFNEISKTYFVSEVYTTVAIAFGKYVLSHNSLGTGKLYIETNKFFSNDKQAFCAGYLEGYLTKDKIIDHNTNMKASVWKNNDIPENVKAFLDINKEYIDSLSTSSSSSYIKIAALLREQLYGLLTGFNLNVDSVSRINYYDLLTMNNFGDIDDIQEYKRAIDFTSMSSKEILDYLIRKSHCSAMIKVLKDKSDVFIGHNTWSSYSYSTRIMKSYTYNFHEGSTNLVFSSYPGCINSIDDFYITSRELVVLETTNPILNGKYFEKMNPKAALTWHRTMISNILSSSGEEWIKYFTTENSGTYNNQFMVFDMNKFNFKKEVSNNTLLIVEQIPGDFKVKDVSSFLNGPSNYWASYNIPFDIDIRSNTGYDGKEYPIDPSFPPLNSLTDYEKCTRAVVFKKEANSINTLDDFKSLIRNNTYKTDTASLNYPGYAISSRYDLAEGPKGVNLCSGAYDAKVISVKEIKNIFNKKMHVVASPSFGGKDNIEPFNWSTSKTCKANSHRGMNDLFDFDWFDFNRLSN